VHEYDGVWTLTGIVVDSDNDVAGMTVVFGGIFASYGKTTTVNTDGTYSLTSDFANLQSGTGTSQTTDYEGVPSNVAWQYVIVV
jgi:hypothetical protein